MESFNDSYQTIQPYEDFKELVYKRGCVLLHEKEPDYCMQFTSYEAVGLEPREILKLCNPLLSGKFERFIDLLESLNEVGLYWKRLTETARLLEITVPETPTKQMNEASWFLYNLDAYWHTVFGLEERIIKFLKTFKRIYKTLSKEEVAFLDIWIEAFSMLKTKATKKVRDPLAHYRSQGMQGLRTDHHWEAALLRGDAKEVLSIEVYDNHYLEYKDYYLGNIRMWIPQHNEALSIMFNKFCSLSLERLELK